MTNLEHFRWLEGRFLLTSSNHVHCTVSVVRYLWIQVKMDNLGMRPSRGVDEILPSRYEYLTASAIDAAALGSIPALFDTVESEGRQMNQC
jgi:hypothetical protein